MGKERSFKLHFIRVENRSTEILRNLARNEIESVLAKHGAVSYNLDDVLSKYIAEDLCHEQNEKGHEDARN